MHTFEKKRKMRSRKKKEKVPVPGADTERAETSRCRTAKRPARQPARCRARQRPQWLCPRRVRCLLRQYLAFALSVCVWVCVYIDVCDVHHERVAHVARETKCLSRQISCSLESLASEALSVCSRCHTSSESAMYLNGIEELLAQSSSQDSLQRRSHRTQRHRTTQRFRHLSTYHIHLQAPRLNDT